MPRLVNFHAPIRYRAPLNKGLLRWWMVEPFRTHSPRLRDLTGKSPITLTATSRLGPRGRPGGFGASVFNGTSSYGQTAAIDLSGISTMTVSFWLYWDTFADDNDMAIESSATASSNIGGIYILPNQSTTTRFQVRVNTSGGANSTVSFTRPSGAVWHHYVCCFDRNAGTQQVTAVYVDGVSQSLTLDNASATATGGFGNHVWNFMARNGGASLFGAGRLDDIRIYNRILPAWEARALMRASRLGYPNELRWSRGVDFLGEAPAAGTTFNYYNRRRRNA